MRFQDQDGRNATQGAVIMLEMLSAVEQDNQLTQRSLSRELGIALGLTNAYLKRCARKGFIKVRQVPLNRYAYYLTPKGFAEKSRLTAEYLTSSLGFFRVARQQCATLFEQCAASGLRTIALAGDGELAEIAVLSVSEVDVRVVCIVDARSGRQRSAGRPIVNGLAEAWALAGGRLDAVLITDVSTPQATYDAFVEAAVKEGLPAHRVMAPPMLRIRHGGLEQRVDAE